MNPFRTLERPKCLCGAVVEDTKDGLSLCPGHLDEFTEAVDYLTRIFRLPENVSHSLRHGSFAAADARRGQR